VTGLQLEEIWIDPLSKSASFSDFWSRRWNITVHTTLKRGVFLPVRRYFSKYVALVATFLVSGLFHEWIVWLTFSLLTPINEGEEECSNASCYQPTYGPATVFFLFQAVLIALEFWLSSKLKATTNWIPAQIAPLLVVCIGGSMAHWFSDGYVHSSFFLDSRVAYVFVRRIGS
jgi:Membrane bound O-acyl transferase family